MPLPLAECPEAGAPVPLDLIRKEMIGNWIGLADSPWMAPYEVAMTFNVDGTYSARDVNTPDAPPAFYYGIDADSPMKQYLVDNVLANGDASGDIDIYWGPNDVTRGAISRIRVCGAAPGDELSFEFFPTWLGHIGPIKYALRRTP